MATVQKAISESSSYTTRTLTTTISAPGIRQDAEISVSPNIDASKVSYVIDEVAETIKVTLTNAEYTSHKTTSHQGTVSYPLVDEYTQPDGSGTGYFRYCVYSNGSTVNAGGGQPGFPARACPSYVTGPGTIYRTTYYFDFIITVIYKTFPEFTIKKSDQLKTAADGWVRVNGQLRQIQQIWVRAGGQLKEV